MILVTIGMQLPFDRLIKAMDEIAARLDEPVVAQTGASSYRPRNFAGTPSIPPGEFDELFRQARLVVAHAGIGTVMNAQRHRKPIVLYPRRARFGEHRNDHQLATCSQLSQRPGIHVAWDNHELASLIAIAGLVAPDALAEATARQRLIEGLRSYLDDTKH